jgi:prolipoprotein diacylglyceryltransferase
LDCSCHFNWSTIRSRFLYDWEYYRNHLSEIILPFRFTPNFEFTGYQGLASHGAAISIIVAMYFTAKRS